MTLEELNDERMESVVEGAKKGDKSKVQIIVDNFQGLIRHSYDESIYEKVNIGWEDYRQECNIKIIECINSFKKKKYSQRCRKCFSRH